MRAMLLATLVLAVGCGEEEAKKYPTYQACFDDKTDVQMKMTIRAIVDCCSEHEIGGMKPPLCGDDDAACINYLTLNLSQTDADIATQTDACSVYITEKNAK